MNFIELQSIVQGKVFKNEPMSKHTTYGIGGPAFAYIIPKDKGGQKIENLNKKSLNLIAKETNEKTLSKPTDLYFSIQFYSDNNLGKVNDYLEKITNLDENIYDLEKFYILALFTDIGEEYFLLYQNFKTKKKAKDFCMNFLSKIDQCLIIDTTKF